MVRYSASGERIIAIIDKAQGIVYKLQNDIREIEKKIDAIQEACSHPKEDVNSKGCSDGGSYYDKTQYCEEFHCLLCDKKWTEDRGTL